MNRKRLIVLLCFVLRRDNRLHSEDQKEFDYEQHIV